MAGVEGQRIRDTFARRGFSGRTFGVAFDPVPLAYGVLPTTGLMGAADFAGGNRLPANSGGGGIGPEPSTTQVDPLGLGEGVFWRSVDWQRKVSVGGEGVWLRDLWLRPVRIVRSRL
jgi:hypothetical protein